MFLSKLLTGLMRSRHTSHPHQKQLVEFYSQFVDEGDLCFDVGANTGNRTDVFLALGAQVVCVEPQPGCVKVLEDKYRGDSRVRIVPKGLAAEMGMMTLSLCHSANTLATFSDKWKTGRFQSYEWEDRVEVPVTTMDKLIEDFGSPDFCKIDVEGFEYQVLRGLSQPVFVLSFEFTREFIRDVGFCLAHLVSLGEFEFNYVSGESPRLASSRWMDDATLITELHRNKAPLFWGDIYARLKQGSS